MKMVLEIQTKFLKLPKIIIITMVKTGSEVMAQKTAILEVF